MTKYITNYCKDYCNHWTPSHAISELVSNYLDSDGEQEFEFTSDSITLTNKNIIVSNKMLISGMSDKRGNDTKRGTFGVGSLQAMVVLTGLGIDISIFNGGIVWTPRFEYCDNFEEEIMVIDETPYYQTNDFSVHISGLDEETISEVKQRCTIFQDREVLHSTEVGDIITGEEGEIFVGDMYVMQSDEFKYCYNFKPSVVPLTQDRNCMDTWELKKLTAKLISMVEDEDFVKEAIEDNSADTQLVHERYYTDKSHGKDTHAAVATLGAEFIAENEGWLVTDDYSEHQENLKLGNPSVYMDNRAKVKSIQDSDVYKIAIATIELAEKQTIDEFIEELNENIMLIVDANMNAQDGARVKQLLDCLAEEGNNWSGDVEDGLPF